MPYFQLILYSVNYTPRIVTEVQLLFNNTLIFVSLIVDIMYVVLQLHVYISGNQHRCLQAPGETWRYSLVMALAVEYRECQTTSHRTGSD